MAETIRKIVTVNQKEQLLLLLKENRKIITEILQPRFREELWDNMAQVLNLDIDGPTKRGFQWRKVKKKLSNYFFNSYFLYFLFFN